MLLNTKPLNIRDTEPFHFYGMPSRVCTTPYGVFAVVKQDNSTALNLVKYDPDTGAVTTYTAPTFILNTSIYTVHPQTSIVCVSLNDYVHIAWVTYTDLGYMTINYIRFDTKNSSFIGEASLYNTSVIQEISTYTNINMVAVSDTTVDMGFAFYIDSYITRIVGITRIDSEIVSIGSGTGLQVGVNSAQQVGRYMLVPITDPINASRRMVLYPTSETHDLTTEDQWRISEWAGPYFYDHSDSAGEDAQYIEGYGQPASIIDRFGTIHIVWSGDKRHTKIGGAFASATSTVGAIQFELPDVEGGIVDGELRNYGYSLAIDDDDLLVFTGASGKIYQGRYNRADDLWTPLRSIKTIGEELDESTYVQIAPLPINNVWYGLAKSDTSGWFFFSANNEVPPRGNVTHDLVLDGRGLNTTGVVSKAEISQVIPRISVATEVKQEDDLTDLSSVTQPTFHHGRGEKEYGDPFAFLDADGLLTHIENQITPQYAPHLSYQTGVGSTGSAIVGGTTVTVGATASAIGAYIPDSTYADFGGYPVDSLLYNGNFYVLIYGDLAADNALWIFNNTIGTWDLVTSGIDTTNGEPQDLEFFDEDLYVAQGDQVNARAYNLSSTTWVDVGQPAYCFKGFDGNLFRADNINEIWFSTDAAADPAASTWSFLGTVDDGAGTTGKIRGFEYYGGTLLVFADFGVWQIIANGNGTYLLQSVIDDAPQRASSNGQARANFQGVMYYNVGHSITRFDGATRQDVGPGRAATAGSKFEPLPLNKRGTITRMVGTDTLLYASIDASARDDGASTIMVTAGTGWHEFWKSSSNDRTMWCYYTPALTATGVLSKRNMWVNDGTSIYYIPLPDNTENGLNDANTVWKVGGQYKVITGWQSHGLPALNKTLHKLISRTENLGPAEQDMNLHVYFQAETGEDTFDTDSWTYLASLSDTVEEIDVTNRAIRDAFPTEYTGAVGGLTYKKIRYMLVLDTDIGGPTTSSTPAIIRDFGTRFAVRPDSRWGWTAIVEAADDMVTLGGAHESNLADETRNFIYEAQDRRGPHFLDDGTLLPVVNHIINPSFEIMTSGLAEGWSTIGSVTTSASRKHKTRGQVSQKITVSATTTSAGIEQTGIYLPAGVELHLECDVFNETGEPVIMRAVDADTGTILGESEPVYPVLAIRPPISFADCEVDIDAQDKLTNVSIQFIVPSTMSSGLKSTTFYLDSCFAYMGTRFPHHYVDGDQPRCQWQGANIKPHLNKSFRSGSYSVYITGVNEGLRVRRSASITPSLESAITLQVREAAS